MVWYIVVLCTGCPINETKLFLPSLFQQKLQRSQRVYGRASNMSMLNEWDAIKYRAASGRHLGPMDPLWARCRKGAHSPPSLLSSRYSTLRVHRSPGQSKTPSAGIANRRWLRRSTGAVRSTIRSSLGLVCSQVESGEMPLRIWSRCFLGLLVVVLLLMELRWTEPEVGGDWKRK
jgi:hypothetical protein